MYHKAPRAIYPFQRSPPLKCFLVKCLVNFVKNKPDVQLHSFINHAGKACQVKAQFKLLYTWLIENHLLLTAYDEDRNARYRHSSNYCMHG